MSSSGVLSPLPPSSTQQYASGFSILVALLDGKERVLALGRVKSFF
jgi:hypothetical protein